MYLILSALGMTAFTLAIFPASYGLIYLADKLLYKLD